MNSPFQGAEIPGMGSMNDPLGFVKKLWGDMHLPGMVTPTVSIDELDKKIKDLQTVEAWLSVNMNMLRGTIQALEVQRATIANLKTMGENFAQQMNSASAKAGFGAAPDTPPTPKSNAAWPMPEQKASAEPAKAPEKPVQAEVETPKAEAKAADDKSEAAAPFANPAAWWNLLQDQFKQAVSKAMEHEMPEPDGKAAGSKSKSAANANGATAKAAPKGSTAAAPKTRAKAPAAKTPAKKVAATTSAKKRATPRAASK